MYLCLHAWKIGQHGLKTLSYSQVVLSSAFESSIALGHYAHLAAALDTSAGPSVRSSKADAPSTAHGLGTAEWFSADLVEKPLIPEIIPGPNVSVLDSPIPTLIMNLAAC